MRFRAVRVGHRAGAIALALVIASATPMFGQPVTEVDNQPASTATATNNAAARPELSPPTEAQSTLRAGSRTETSNAPTTVPETKPETEGTASVKAELAAEDQPGFTVIINASNPTARLPRKRVAKLFLKKIKKWDGWDQSVEPVDQRDDSEQRDDFTGAVHGVRVRWITEFWLRMIFSGRGAPPEELSGDQAVVAFVAKNPGAIGYVSASITLDARVKPLIISD